MKFDTEDPSLVLREVSETTILGGWIDQLEIRKKSAFVEVKAECGNEFCSQLPDFIFSTDFHIVLLNGTVTSFFDTRFCASNQVYVFPTF